MKISSSLRLRFGGLLAEIARQHNITVTQLEGSTRGGVTISRARAHVWSALRELEFSYPEIAKLTGMDHTSVMHGVRRHRERMRLEQAKFPLAAATRVLEQLLLGAGLEDAPSFYARRFEGGQ